MQITNEAKRAIINCLQNAAYANENAPALLNTLNSVFFPVDHITAVYTQSGTVTASTPLDDLKDDLVVTAVYEDATTEVLAADDYVLTGTLAAGTSTITVSYSGKTATFNVTVTAESSYVTDGLIHQWDGINNTGDGHSSAATTWADLVGNYDLELRESLTWGDDCITFPQPASSTSRNFMRTALNNIDSAKNATVEVVIKPNSSGTYTVAQLCYDSSYAADAFGKINTFSDNTISVMGKSGYTYSTGVNALTDVRHIAATYSSVPDVNNVYVNGVAASVSTKSHSLRNTVERMIVGGSMQSSGANDVAYPFYGNIYAIRIYNRNLTAGEIAQNYAEDVRRFSL